MSGVPGQTTVYGVSPGTVTITYNDGGGTTCTIGLIVEGPVSVAAISGPSTYCVHQTVTMTDATTGGVWSSGTPAVSNITAGTGVARGLSAGTDIITYKVTNTCGTYTATKHVTVNPAPDAGNLSSVSGLFEACYNDGLVMMTDGTTGGTWASSDITVATVDPSAYVALVYAVAPGTSDISYTVTNSYGCTASSVQTIIIDDNPDAGTITGTAEVCVGGSTLLSDAVAGGTWSSGSTLIATVDASGNVYGIISTGVVPISYTVSNTCGDAQAYVNVTVDPYTDPGTISGGISSICPGATLPLTESVAGGSWISDNTGVATIDASGTVSGASSGTANITYLVSTGCLPAYASITVTIDPGADAGTITGSPICAGPSSPIWYSSSGVSGGTWSSSATAIATISSAGEVYGASSGTSVITYAVNNSCGSSYTTAVASVDVTPSLVLTGTGTYYYVPSLSYYEICQGSTALTLTASTTGGTWWSGNSTLATVDINSGRVFPNTSYTVDLMEATFIGYTVTNTCGTYSATTVIMVDASSVTPTITGSTAVNYGTVTDYQGFPIVFSGNPWNVSRAYTVNGSISGSISSYTDLTTLIEITFPSVTQTVTVNYSFTNTCNTFYATPVPITVTP